jgi:hypothetical protein
MESGKRVLHDATPYYGSSAGLLSWKPETELLLLSHHIQRGELTDTHRRSGEGHRVPFPSPLPVLPTTESDTGLRLNLLNSQGLLSWVSCPLGL